MPLEAGLLEGIKIFIRGRLITSMSFAALCLAL